jgi:peroxiredoxin
LQSFYSEFQARGAELAALAVNTRQSVEEARSTVNAAYPMLADPEHQVAEAYGVFDLLGDGLAAPALFVIGSDGRILWSHIGQDSSDRPATADVLAQLP